MLKYSNLYFLSLQFCDKCDSKLIRTGLGLKCPKCDGALQIPKKPNPEKRMGDHDDDDDDFPFQKNEYYESKYIRKRLGFNQMSGMRYNTKENFLTLIRYAHKPKPHSSNPYLDGYDSDLKKYYYTGQGRSGNQTRVGVNGNNVNGRLADAKKNDTTIHLFWQHNHGSDHEYIGKMNMKNCETKTQKDEDGKDRDVFVFTLSPA